MLTKDGEQQLREFSESMGPREIKKIGESIYYITGYGHSNMIAAQGKTGLLVIDALESPVRAGIVKDELYRLTGKHVETLVYTHGHPDHRGGAGAFRDTVKTVIASTPRKRPMNHEDRLQDVLGVRTRRQFGYDLTEDEVITQGLGMREGHAVGQGMYDIMPVSRWFTKETEDFDLDGIRFRLISAPGETDDQMYVWFPEEKVLCCGDNYYGCWPNLYAIRGGQYRDVAAWADSLELLLSFEAEILLPGHRNGIWGREQIRDVIGNYKRAIETVLYQTLDCMNRGMSESETVLAVKLPEDLAEKPYLKEFYGTVAWSVRSVYHGYLGWFDGNPSNLNRLPDSVRSGKLLDALGGGEKVGELIQKALKDEDWQWAAELCDMMDWAGCDDKRTAKWKAAGLMELAKMETSANGRHYYIASAHELIHG